MVNAALKDIIIIKQHKNVLKWIQECIKTVKNMLILELVKSVKLLILVTNQSIYIEEDVLDIHIMWTHNKKLNFTIAEN